MYCIDTSALIHGWRRDYPPDVFRSLWEQLDQLIKIGKLFSSFEVLLELERGGDDIYNFLHLYPRTALMEFGPILM